MHQVTSRERLLEWSRVARSQSGNGKRPAAYLGVDPTAASMHVGHLVGVEALRVLADEGGFRPIALVGGATAMIGDPSGKSEERNMIDAEVVRHNAECVAMQLRELVGEDTKLVNNAPWFESMSTIAFLRDVGRHFRVHTMLSRDSVKSRMASSPPSGSSTSTSTETVTTTNQAGLSFTEFSYQILQSFDFLHLFRTEGCVVQVGGSDQWGNMLGGVDLVRRLHDGKEVVAVTCPLVTVRGADAKPVKLGKTAGNAVWLDPKLTSDMAFYQYFVRLEDEDAQTMLRMLVGASSEGGGAAVVVRGAQTALAKAMTLRVRGKDALAHAERMTDLLFGAGASVGLLQSGLAPDELLRAATDAGVPVYRVPSSTTLPTAIEAAFRSGATESMSAAKRLEQQGALLLNGAKIAPGSGSTPLSADAFLGGRVALMRVGRSRHVVLDRSS